LRVLSPAPDLNQEVAVLQAETALAVVAPLDGGARPSSPH